MLFDINYVIVNVGGMVFLSITRVGFSDGVSLGEEDMREEGEVASFEIEVSSWHTNAI